MSTLSQNERWDIDEDALLLLAIEKYGTTNWYKIVSNLISKRLQQVKLRWKNWIHPIVNKRKWSLSEDSQIYYKLKRKSYLLLTKLHPKNRIHWQYYFRGIIMSYIEKLNLYEEISKTAYVYQTNLANIIVNEKNEEDKKVKTMVDLTKNETIKIKLICITGKKNVKKKGQEKFRKPLLLRDSKIKFQPKIIKRYLIQNRKVKDNPTYWTIYFSTFLNNKIAFDSK